MADVEKRIQYVGRVLCETTSELMYLVQCSKCKSIWMQVSSPANDICALCQKRDSSGVGNLYDLPSMTNVRDREYGRDFYHYCPAVDNKLVRLNYDEDRDEHRCSVCGQVYLPK